MRTRGDGSLLERRSWARVLRTLGQVVAGNATVDVGPTLLCMAGDGARPHGLWVGRNGKRTGGNVRAVAHAHSAHTKTATPTAGSFAGYCVRTRLRLLLPRGGAQDDPCHGASKARRRRGRGWRALRIDEEDGRRGYGVMGKPVAAAAIQGMSASIASRMWALGCPAASAVPAESRAVANANIRQRVSVGGGGGGNSVKGEDGRENEWLKSGVVQVRAGKRGGGGRAGGFMGGLATRETAPIERHTGPLMERTKKMPSWQRALTSALPDLRLWTSGVGKTAGADQTYGS
ncbi:hypothetical protein DFH09DRAFT_1085570 [Mycena vulgaris]|nr:hypothetical protein DFH09DRAFT_1085570 [Mycena vulgaris]